MSPGEESHWGVEVPANVRGSRVPAEEADRMPAKEGVAVRCKGI